jgi:hypothetical protein
VTDPLSASQVTMPPGPLAPSSSAPADSGASAGDAGLPADGRSAGGGGGGPAPSRFAGAVHRIGAMLRTHWFFTIVLAVGAAGRVLTMVAYRPALLYIDSFSYLTDSRTLSAAGNEPMGYPLVLRLLLDVGNFEFVVAVQHLLGLAMGLCIYILLLRHRMPKTLAALASMPVLLDAYEWQIEQNILTDSLFLALITAALVLLTWRRRPGPWLAASAGLLLGCGGHGPAGRRGRADSRGAVRRARRGRDLEAPGQGAGAFVVACAVPLGSYVIYATASPGRTACRRATRSCSTAARPRSPTARRCPPTSSPCARRARRRRGGTWARTTTPAPARRRTSRTRPRSRWPSSSRTT